METRYLTCLLVAALLFLAAEPAMAGIGVNGALFKGVGNPGDSVYHEMIVSIGENDTPKNISVQVMGFGQTLGGVYSPLKPEDDTSYSARPFLDVNLTEFHLESGGSQTVLMTGKIPGDVGVGGKYALVQIRTKSGGGEGIGISLGVDVPVLLTINDTELIYTGDITDLNYEIDEIESGQEIDVSLIFKNTGNHHYKANVKAALEDKEGEVFAEVSIPLGFSSIIPPNSRESKMTLKPISELEPGTYFLRATVTSEAGAILASEEITLEI